MNLFKDPVDVQSMQVSSATTPALLFLFLFFLLTFPGGKLIFLASVIEKIITSEPIDSAPIEIMSMDVDARCAFLCKTSSIILAIYRKRTKRTMGGGGQLTCTLLFRFFVYFSDFQPS